LPAQTSSPHEEANEQLRATLLALDLPAVDLEARYAELVLENDRLKVQHISDRRRWNEVKDLADKSLRENLRVNTALGMLRALLAEKDIYDKGLACDLIDKIMAIIYL